MKIGKLRWSIFFGGLVFSAFHLTLWGSINLTPTVTLVEAEWTGTSVVGILLSGGFMIDVLLDRRANIRSRLNGARQATVEVFVILGLILVAVHALFVVAGVGALLAPPASTLSPTAVLTRVLFAVIAQTFVLGLFRVRSLRHYLTGT